MKVGKVGMLAINVRGTKGNTLKSLNPKVKTKEVVNADTVKEAKTMSGVNLKFTQAINMEKSFKKPVAITAMKTA